MRKIYLIVCLFSINSVFSQENINDILAAGINDAHTFTGNYLAPATEGAMFSISNGWFNSADAKPLLGFEIGIIGNITSVKDERKSFTLNIDDYENLRFSDGSTSREVATALGDINDVDVVVEGPMLGPTDDAEFTLPSGFNPNGVNFITERIYTGKCRFDKRH